MTLVGCDLHSRKQQVAVLDTRTGELVEQELAHDGDSVERFYRALSRPVTIGIEPTGYTQWFHALMHRLGHPVLVGEAAKIRALVVRKTKTDRRDARHLLDLLQHDRFPTVWIPDPDTRDRRALIAHRVRLVRMRTMVKNGRQAIALNQRLALRSALWTQRGLAQLKALVLPAHARRRRDDSLELLAWLTTRIDQLDDQIAALASADPRVQLLLTHPGGGPLTALTPVLVWGPLPRFADSKHVVSYVGLAPAVNASAAKQRLGQITKQEAPPGSAGCWARPLRSPPGRMTICGAATSAACIGAGGPRRRSPSPASSSFASTSCCAIGLTTRNSGAAGGRPDLTTSRWPSCNAPTDLGRLPKADVPVRAFSR
jgi:transposase